MKASDKKALQLFPDREKDDLSNHAHRQLIGSVGLVLPVLLWLIAGWRPIGEHPWVPLRSVSAYYYSGAVSVFAGMLVALALFLFTYRGYDNKYYRRDRAAAIIAGSAALLVALFPTGADLEALTLPWWTRLTGVVHFVSAAVLFGSFIFFSLVQFPIARLRRSRPLPRAKRIRNVIYVTCGLAMAACVAWATIAGLSGAPIFWPEVLALEFFAISWLVKGRAYSTAAAAARRAVYYGRHPRELAKAVQTAIRSQPDAGGGAAGSRS